ncbi:MAG: hypothetical protein IPK16_32880 [Anaerolineales bacterium]|nr:hypothetical protein [Anaerolineales bacterium]
MIINTTNRLDAVQRAQEAAAASTGADVAPLIPYPDQVFQTAMTGDVLKQAIAKTNDVGLWKSRFFDRPR